MDSPSENANHCMQFQLRKKTSAKLRDHLDEESLWETVKAFNNYIFHSADGQKYSYTVDGEMVCFSSVILSRKEIESAFNQALRTQNECDRMDLLPFGKGAEELNTVFHRIGVYNEKA